MADQAQELDKGSQKTRLTSIQIPKWCYGECIRPEMVMNTIKLYDTRNTHMEDNLWEAYRVHPHFPGGFRSYVQEKSSDGIIAMNQDGDIEFQSEQHMMLFILRWS